MKHFNIYSNPQGNYIAIKQGWSWFGAILTFIWAFFNKMWAIGITVLFIIILLTVIGGFVGEKIDNIISIIWNATIAIVFGMNGNEWKSNSLISRGYEFQDTVSASNSEGAIAQFLKNKGK